MEARGADDLLRSSHTGRAEPGRLSIEGCELSSATEELADYLPGVWSIDPVRSSLAFSVGHLGLHTVHGTLGVSGQITVAEDPLDSAVDASIDLGSVNTGSKGRD